MPEELAFKEVLRDGRTVDHNERGIASRAQKVYEMGCQLFPGPGLSGNKDRPLTFCHPPHQGEDIFHGLAFGDDLQGERPLFHCLFHYCDILVNGDLLLYLLDHFQQHREIHRLFQEFARPQFHGRDGGVHIAKGRDHNDPYRGIHPLHLLQHRIPAKSGHAVIEENQMDRFAFKEAQGLRAVRSRQGRVALLFQKTPQKFPLGRIIVDNQNFHSETPPRSLFLAAALSPATASGSQAEISTVPGSGTRTVMLPPWASTILRDMVSPRPVPSALVV